MATNRTFTMIKPDATGAGNTGKIIDRIIGAGFTIKAMKWTQLSMERCRCVLRGAQGASFLR